MYMSTSFYILTPQYPWGVVPRPLKDIQALHIKWHRICTQPANTLHIQTVSANYVNSWRLYCLWNNNKSSSGRFRMDAIFSWMFFMFQIKPRASLMLNKYSASQLQMCPKYFQIEVGRICRYGTHGNREPCVCVHVCMCTSQLV